MAGVRRDVLSHIEGFDWSGNTTGFAAPLIFVPVSTDDGPTIGKLVDAYNGQAGGPPVVPESSARRNIPVGGQKVAFAPSERKGDTELETETFILGALNAIGSPHFLPGMSGARVNNPALRQISKDAGPSLVRFEQSFLDAPSNAFGNAGEIYLKIDAPNGVKFPVEKTGGLVAPDFTPQGISRTFGAAGDVAAFAAGPSLRAGKAAWVPTVFTKNRDRLLEADVARKFLAELMHHKELRGRFRMNTWRTGRKSLFAEWPFRLATVTAKGKCGYGDQPGTFEATGAGTEEPLKGVLYELFGWPFPKLPIVSRAGDMWRVQGSVKAVRGPDAKPEFDLAGMPIGTVGTFVIISRGPAG